MTRTDKQMWRVHSTRIISYLCDFQVSFLFIKFYYLHMFVNFCTVFQLRGKPIPRIIQRLRRPSKIIQFIVQSTQNIERA